jgi:hypothetical protein
MMTNREKFEAAGAIDPDAELTPEEDDAVESLTPQEVDALISARNKLGDVSKNTAMGLIGLRRD